MGCCGNNAIESHENGGHNNMIPFQSKIQEENIDIKKAFNNEISFRCTYDIKNINNKTLIMNDRIKYIDEENEVINKEIKEKVKILNGNIK